MQKSGLVNYWGLTASCQGCFVHYFAVNCFLPAMPVPAGEAGKDKTPEKLHMYCTGRNKMAFAKSDAKAI